MRNPIQDAFANVHVDEALKQNAKRAIAARIQSTPKPRAVPFRRLVLACASLIVMLVGLAGWRLYDTPISAISVDINPSIELGINRWGRVVRAEGVNQEGIAVAGAVPLTNLPYNEALERLIDSDAAQPYIANDGFVSITVIGRTDEESEIMRSQIAACDYAKRPNVECQCGRRSDVAAAHEAGLSFGKYQVYLALQALDPSITVEEIRGLTMRQLKDMLQALSAFDESERNEGRPNECSPTDRGSGYHGGRGAQ